MDGATQQYERDTSEEDYDIKSQLTRIKNISSRYEDCDACALINEIVSEIIDTSNVQITKGDKK